MSQLVVSNLDESIETELKRGATTMVGANLSGPPERTSDEEVRQILQQSLQQSGAQPVAAPASEELGLGTRIASRFAGGEFGYDIPEWRGETIEPMEFE